MNIRLMVGTITRKTKKKANERPKDKQPAKTKKRKKLVPLMVGNYFTHGPSNVTCMQIMKFNTNGRFRTSITYQHNLFLFSKGQSRLKNNINTMSEKLNAKRQG
jgi:hypothetical protein